MNKKKEIQINLITNCILLPRALRAFKDAFSLVEMHIELNLIDFNILTENSLQLGRDDEICVIVLNYETLLRNQKMHNSEESQKIEFIKLCVDKIKSILSGFKGLVVIFGFENIMRMIDYVEGPRLITGVAEANRILIDSFSKQENYVMLDMQKIIAKFGSSKSYDYLKGQVWNLPYSYLVDQSIADCTLKQYKIWKKQSPKCLILDCDNVLWGGIASEDSMNELEIGYEGRGIIYKEFQEFIANLLRRGLLLALCSKNDTDDVLRVFEEHDEMVITKENLANWKINWEPKYKNILNIVDEMNLNEESFVFIDDDPNEIQAVRTAIPKINSILFDPKTVYEELSIVNCSESINCEMAKIRTDTYRTDVMRKTLHKAANTYEEYLKQLGTVVKINNAKQIELDRIWELNNRVSRCTNGNRYSKEELWSLMHENNYYLHSVYVSDRFSDLGLVGAIGIEENTIDLFCLSCRALGRTVEDMMIQFIRKEYPSCDTMHYCDTGRNSALLAKLKEFYNGNKGKD